MNKLVAVCIGVGLLAACQGTHKQEKLATPQDSAVKTSVKPSLPVNTQWNQLCEWLSGDTAKLGTQNPSNAAIWKNYAKETNIKWNVLQSRVVRPISEWISTSKLEQPNEPKTLLYPFAGGDFFYPHLFFPNQDTIIMVGLEPSGHLFNADTAKPAALAQYLKDLEHSLFFPHRLGFFRTLSMEVDFNRGYLNGTLHTTLYYMAKFGYQIHYIKAFDIDDNGNPINEVEVGSTAHKRKAIKVGYSSKTNDEAIREWIYITGDLSDQALVGKSKGLYNYLNNHHEVCGFFKAASYLMHNDYFSKIRGIMVKNSKRILQDDSGIPYKFLKDNGFKVTLLGEYTRTIALFSTRVQPDMKADYASQKPAKLPFNIGYNAEFNQCNLQSAIK